MDGAALALAITPPCLAILLEMVNPVNERFIRRNVQNDLWVLLGQKPQYLDAVERVTKISAAATEIAGLAPTLVASVISGFAVIHELEQPLFPAAIYTLTLIGVAVFLVWLLAGRSLHDVGEIAVAFKFALGLCLEF